MNEHREVELKLAIHADDVAAFRRLPLLRERCVDGPTRRKVFNLYLDTAEATLERHAMELRLRKIGGKWLQTLKTAGATGGALQQRGEWEFEQPSAQVDLALFRETPLADLAHARQLHQRLKPAFTTVFQRTIWLIEWAHGQRVEVALDLGAIHSGQRQAAIAEVEIELVAGDVATVFEVARSLLEQIALMPESRGKALRGYQLFRPRPSNPVSGESISLERDWSQGQVMRAIAAACNRHFAANLSGALDSDNPEFIHQLRVSLRTLRSALHLFKPSGATALVNELKWLTAALFYHGTHLHLTVARPLLAIEWFPILAIFPSSLLEEHQCHFLLVC